MNIIVCVKQVPDTTEVRLDKKNHTLIRDGVPSIINPDDKTGIEAALRLKEQNPGSKVTLVSMGPPQAGHALREGLAMGCDEALLLSDRAFGGADTWATSYTIASAIKKLDYDLILTGRQAIDGDTAQVGPQIAEHLGLPQVSYACKLEQTGEKTLRMRRQLEDGYQVVEVSMPCLVTVLSELAKPRYRSVRGIVEAYEEKEVKLWTLEDLKDVVDAEKIGLQGSPTRVRQSFPRPAKGDGIVEKELTAQEAADRIWETMKENHLIG